MPYAVSQGITVQLGGADVANVTSVTVNETAPNIDSSDLSLSSGAYRKFIPGLKDAAEVTMNHIGASISTGDKVGGLTVGNISFTGATVMSSDVAYRVGEIVAYTTMIRAANNS
jgi:hypothetical protein